MKNTPRIQSVAHKIWILHIPTRMKVFGWLMLLNKLFTTDNLNKRGWRIVNGCVLCKAQSESVKHMLDDCIFSKSEYYELAIAILYRMPPLVIDNISTQILTCSTIPKIQKGTIMVTQLCILTECCTRTFSQGTTIKRE